MNCWQSYTHAWLVHWWSDGKICALKWCVYKTPSCKSGHNLFFAVVQCHVDNCVSVLYCICVVVTVRNYATLHYQNVIVELCTGILSF